MNDDNPLYNLSRRKLLGGLGAVGLASAGAGLGTSAYLNDTESFENNSLEAGTLDLLVDYTTEYHGATVQTSSGTSADGTVPVELADVKPGDWGHVELCFVLDDNPGYLWVAGAITGDDENGYEEPEPDASPDDLNDPGDPDGRGELADLIEVELTYANGTPIIAGPKVPRSMRAVFSELAYGLPLDGVPWTAANASPGREPYPAGTNDGDNCFVLSWHVPATVENEIQGDSLTFSLTCYAEQARHNAGVVSPVTGTNRVTLDPMHGTFGPSTFGFGTAGSAPAGWAGGSWSSSDTEDNWDGGIKEQLYVGPGFVPFNPLPTFTVDDIESIRYRTKTPAGTANDYYLSIYTLPTGTSSDDASWYGKLLQAVPAKAENVNAPAGQWNTWQTSAGTNQLTFADINVDGIPYTTSNGQPTLADLQSGPIDWSTYDNDAPATAIDYGPLVVMDMAFSTGSGWTETFEGELDGIVISLTDGGTFELDLDE